VLHEFIAVNREEIIQRCRAKVATRSIPPPTEAEIDHGVPVFLDQLRNALRLGETTSPANWPWNWPHRSARKTFGY
jgi:hypothetical protein